MHLLLLLLIWNPWRMVEFDLLELLLLFLIWNPWQMGEFEVLLELLLLFLISLRRSGWRERLASAGCCAETARGISVAGLMRGVGPCRTPECHAGTEKGHLARRCQGLRLAKASGTCYQAPSRHRSAPGGFPAS